MSINRRNFLARRSRCVRHSLVDDSAGLQSLLQTLTGRIQSLSKFGCTFARPCG